MAIVCVIDARVYILLNLSVQSAIITYYAILSQAER